MKKKYNIAITCIGSGVGQSIINSLKLSSLPIQTIGFGTNPFAFGAYDCDIYDYTSSIYSQNYIDELIKKYKEYNIDLLIPSLDYEVLLFAQNENKLKKFGINAIFSLEKMANICHDKEKMSIELNEIKNVFVKNYNKKTVIKDIDKGKVKFPFIAKPKNGFASKGIEIITSMDDFSKIDENHILQELAMPIENDPNYDLYITQIAKNNNLQVSEISIQIVFDQFGKLIGKMSSINKLNNGVPIEVLPYENEYIWGIIDLLIPTFIRFGLKGPLNIQGRITEQGLKIFEMNPRFTGITGLRALMGFNEVESCVKEWLGIDVGHNQIKLNHGKFGIRQTVDKCLSYNRNKTIKTLSKKLNNKKIDEKKTILITGSSGYLGRSLIRQMIKENSFNIWVLGRNKEILNTLYKNKLTNIYAISDLKSGRIKLGNVDILLHLGFARPHRSNLEISDSLTYTSELFTLAFTHQIPEIINISTQSVYGIENELPNLESIPVNPFNNYAQAKYATELILKSLKKIYNHINYTSLRLGSLVGGSEGLIENDLISKICKKAVLGQTIEIVDGNQKIEKLDIRDSVSAICKILKSDSSKWSPVYNLSSSNALSLLSITQLIIKIASSYNNGLKSNIKIIDEQVNYRQEMNSQLFCKTFQWKSTYTLEDSINSTMEYLNKKKLKRIM